MGVMNTAGKVRGNPLLIGVRGKAQLMERCTTWALSQL